MASPVPYDPTLQVPATSQGISPIRVDANAAAFGSGIADQISHLGQVTQAAGNELFDRAYAMQTVNITAQANQAQADATDEASKLNAEYRMKQGNEAVQGYDQFQKDIRDTYAKHREGLDSPIAQKLFDQDSRRNQSYMISGGALHMAQEGKTYAKTTNTALLDQAEQQVFNDPSNEKLFNDNIQHVRDVAAHNAALEGYGPEATKYTVDNAVSNIALKRVMGLAKTDPFGAQKLFDRLQQAGTLPAGKGAGDMVGKDVGVTAEPGEGGKVPFGVPYKPGSISVRSGADVKDLSPSARGMLDGIVQAGVQPKVIAGFAQAGHVGHSQHYVGNAVDFDVAGWSDEQKSALVQAGMNNGARGIGIYPSGNTIHMDTRDNPTAWGPGADGIYKGASLDKFPDWAQKVMAPMFQTGQRSGGMIRGDKAPEVQAFINQKLVTTGARQTAADLRNSGDPVWAQGDVGLDRGMAAIQQIENAPGKANMKTSTKDGDFALGLYQIKGSNLAPWLREAGMPDMTYDEFLADPSAQKQLARFKINQYYSMYHDWDAVATKWFAGTTHPAPDANDGHSTVPEYLHRFHNALAGNASGADVQRVAESRAGQLAPGNYEFQDALQQQLEVLHQRQNRIDNETMMDNQNKVMDEINQGRLNGQRPSNIDELSPDGRQAFESLDARRQKSIIDAMAQLEKGDYSYGNDPKKLAQFQQLLGIANDPKRTAQETQEFLSADFSNAPFPIADRKRLWDAQQRLRKNEEANPQVNTAMSILGMNMPSAMPNKKDDAEGYNQFIGAVHESMSEFVKAEARPMNNKEIITMGTLLAQKIAQEKAGWFGTSIGAGTEQVPLYKIPVPEKARQAIISDWMADHYGAKPNEEQIHSIFIAHEYQQLVDKVPPAPPPMPTAPIGQ